MKIAVIAPSALPARRANAIQTVRMAQAFARLGHEVLLVAYSPYPAISPLTSSGQSPRPSQSFPLGRGGRPSSPAPLPAGEGDKWEVLAEEYGLEVRFEVQWLRARGWARRYDFALQAVWQVRRWGAERIFTRLPQSATAASLLGIPTIFEAHDLPRRGAAHFFRLFLLGKGAKRVVAISQVLAQDLMEAFPSLSRFPRAFLTVAPDGVDLRPYTPPLSPLEARQRLRQYGWELPSGFIAGYTGHLYRGRGAEWMVALAAAVPQVHFLIVGGEAEQCQQLERQLKARRLSNYTLTGLVTPQKVPLFQMASDVLLMPYQAQVAASSGGDIAHYLSPMKLFEYLAAARPILASDLPVLREVLNAENAILLPIQELAAWESALRRLVEEPERRRGLGEAARHTAQRYSWESRAEGILSG
ncbi:MAG: glycosyltransferase [Anaerolineales bacterium]